MIQYFCRWYSIKSYYKTMVQFPVLYNISLLRIYFIPSSLYLLTAYRNMPLLFEYIVLLPNKWLTSYIQLYVYVFLYKTYPKHRPHYTIWSLSWNPAVCPFSLVTLRDNIWLHVCVQSHKYWPYWGDFQGWLWLYSFFMNSLEDLISK